MTETLFCTLVGCVAAQRVVEVMRSRRNERYIISQGGEEHFRAHYKAMVAVHTLWLLSMVAEVLLLRRPFVGWLAVPALAVFGVGQWLRLLARRALDWRWTVRIFTLQHMPPVTRGIYRHVRHPNYLGVVLEIAALPLVHGAYLTAAVFSVMNSILLLVRIRREENALRRTVGYSDAVGTLPRFFPRLTRTPFP